MQDLQQQDLLIDEQKVQKPNPLYSLANITRQHVTQPYTHTDAVHARPAYQQHQLGVSPSLNVFNMSTI